MTKAERKQEQRRDRLAALLAEYQQVATDYDAGEEEDPRPYLSGETPCGRFVCVTDHESKIFFLPTFATAEIAMARAVEYVHDDIWPELPVAVVDLDTGRRYYPDFGALPWTVQQP